MITLYQFAPAFGLPNASPFCMKVETYLRMAQLPFEAQAAGLRELRGAPKGKLPYIRDGQQTVADSSFIIDYLKRTYGDPLDGWLDPRQQALALAFQRLFEEHLYWALIHNRWAEAPGWAQTRQAFFGRMSAPLKWIVPHMARRGILRQLAGQGMGRHSAAEIHAMGQRDITAIAHLLVDQPFMMGAQPCTLDATAYAFLANLLWAPVASPMQAHARLYPQLQAYCQRMQARYYPQARPADTSG